MTTARFILLFLAAFLAPATSFAVDDSPCLSLSEVHGGYPRYHIIRGRQCWYASTPGPQAKPSQAKPSPTPQSDDINVNPYGDSVWQQPDAKGAQSKPRPAKPNPVVNIYHASSDAGYAADLRLEPAYTVGGKIGGVWSRSTFNDPFGPSIFGDGVIAPGFLAGGLP